MRILRVHNRYQERGGEDVVFEAEVELLREHGVDVATLDVSNDEIPAKRSAGISLGLAISTVWARRGRALVAEAAARCGPDVIHFDNTFPLISPAAYAFARLKDVAVVQTLHNYRLLCPNASFFRNGNVCEDCLSKPVPYPAIAGACYRQSRSQTSVVAAMLTVHRLAGTWKRDVDRYIALTEFARQKFIEGGLPADRIVIKPNFVALNPTSREAQRHGFLFVARLVPEKGIATMLNAWQRRDMPLLRVAGDGPLRSDIEAGKSDPIRPLGLLDRDRVIDMMRSAQALIFPSEWYEGFPMTIAEAFACGTPVIASRLGAMAEIIEDGTNGLLFEPSNAEDLAAKVCWANEHPAEMRQMGENARREYDSKYTAERNHEMLMDIYEQAIDHAQRRTNAAS